MCNDNIKCFLCLESDKTMVRVCYGCKCYAHKDCWNQYFHFKWDTENEYPECPVCRRFYPVDEIDRYNIASRKADSIIIESNTIKDIKKGFHLMATTILTVEKKYFPIFIKNFEGRVGMLRSAYDEFKDPILKRAVDHITTDHDLSTVKRKKRNKLLECFIM